MKNLASLIIAMLFCLSLSAQTRPTIKGRVVDSTTNKAIEFANVVVTDSDNKTIASTSVNGGEFLLKDLRKRECYLSVMLVGYQPYTSE